MAITFFSVDSREWASLHSGSHSSRTLPLSTTQKILKLSVVCLDCSHSYQTRWRENTRAGAEGAGSQQNFARERRGNAFTSGVCEETGENQSAVEGGARESENCQSTESWRHEQAQFRPTTRGCYRNVDILAVRLFLFLDELHLVSPNMFVFWRGTLSYLALLIFGDN